MNHLFNLPPSLIKLLIVAAVTLLWQCNPVKKVLNDPVKFEKVAQEVVKRGYCVNDTIFTVKTKDSIVYKDTIFYIEVPKYLPAECNLDTVTKEGFHIIIKNGNIRVQFKGAIPHTNTTRTEVQTVRDRKYEDILKNELRLKSDTLSALKVQVQAQKVQIEEQMHRIYWWNFKFYLLLIISVLYVILSFYNKIRTLLVRLIS